MREFLLWDHDGVLVDTERWYFQASRDVLGEIGIGLSQQQCLDFMVDGRSCWDLARAAGYDEPRIEALRARRDRLYQELLRTKDIEIDGVAEVLGHLAGRHRMAIVTTARRADFDLIHARRDLLRHFELVLTVEDYPRAKPAPDPYLAALAHFGAEATRALAIEDSSRGLRSAVAAGIACVVVKNTFTASQNFTAAFRVLDSVRQLPELLAAIDR